MIYCAACGASNLLFSGLGCYMAEPVGSAFSSSLTVKLERLMKKNEMLNFMKPDVSAQRKFFLISGVRWNKT